MNRTSFRRGFTLIELLVVIAIIAILAAILFPVFAQAKLSAQKATDTSNIKQLLLATQMYLNDNDDVFHRLQTGPVVTANAKIRQGSEAALQPYVKNQQVWGAPTDPFARTFCGAFNSPAGKAPGVKVSYSFTFNGQPNNNAEGETFGLHGVDNDSGVNAGNSMSQSGVGQPASTIHLFPLWMTSSHWNNRSWWRFYAANLRSWPVFPQTLSIDCNGTGDGRATIGAFNGQTNWGFADGHVQSMPQARIMDPLWVTNFNQAITSRARNLVHFNEAYKN
jgi:prepilin-type N-terminal cleavage/methylation domain-containing protein/prepilin-type processing-associated H-X9-DG protein